MPFYVGPGSAPAGGLEMRSDRVGFPTATSDPASAVVGDMYIQTVGTGVTWRVRKSNGWSNALGSLNSAGITATGGSKSTAVSTPDGNIWTYHFFASTGPQPFNVTAVNGPGQIEYILIAGGGSGGYSQNGANRNGGGGGGAGGLITNFAGHPYAPRSPGTLAVTVQDYSLNIGAGAPNEYDPPNAGGDTTGFSLTANGGGDGGQNEGQNANPGGSGGGGGAIANTSSSTGASVPASDPSRQGNPGGDGAPSAGGGGGGGGTGASGTPGSSGTNGGIGVVFVGNYLVPDSYGTTGPTPGRWFCGGGSGGSNGPPVGPAGAGGGGSGSTTDVTGSQGTDYTGGGGGGAGGGPLNTSGGRGGHGIIILRYQE
jgi:hypothetical protein